MTTQYDAFADDYHWLFSHEGLTGEPTFERSRELLGPFGASAKVLDCACGIGTWALALARRGYSVTGTDSSAGMVARARQRARQAAVNVEFDTCRWDGLPDKLGERYDVVFCCGNAIGHCQDEAEMIASLRGMRAVLEDGGLLVLDTRNWEKLLADRPSFTAMRPKERGGQRCIPVYVWSIPSEWGQPLTIEVVLVFEKDGETSLRSYPITYYPFRCEELIDRLGRAGFADVETNYAAANEGYRVTSRRNKPAGQ